MAIGNVVDELPHSPTALAIGRIELLVRQAPHGLTQLRRGRGDLVDPLLETQRAGFVFTDRVARIVHMF